MTLKQSKDFLAVCGRYQRVWEGRCGQGRDVMWAGNSENKQFDARSVASLCSSVSVLGSRRQHPAAKLMHNTTKSEGTNTGLPQYGNIQIENAIFSLLAA